jgi:hypothetical protein
MDALIVIYCDNISSILLANNLVYHARTKHIVTKALGIDKLKKFRKMFGVLKVDLSLRGSVENSNSTN